MIEAGALEKARAVSVREVISQLGLRPAREAHKYGCPGCGSSDAAHAYREALFCFSCGRRFDAIELVQLVFDKSFKEAVEWLSGEHFGASRRPTRTPSPSRPDEQINWRAIGRIVVEELGVVETAAARGYLSRRGLTPSVVAPLGVYAPSAKSWMRVRTRVLPEVQLPERTPLLVLRYLDLDGAAAGFRLRFRDGWRPKYYSPRGFRPRAPFLAPTILEQARQQGLLFVVEGEIDALSLVVEGHAAVGIPGAGAFDPRWTSMWSSVDSIVVIGDGDDAGRRFVESVWEAHVDGRGQAQAPGRLKAFQCATGLDVNDMLVAGTLAALIRGLRHEC